MRSFIDLKFQANISRKGAKEGKDAKAVKDSDAPEAFGSPLREPNQTAIAPAL
jgi:hypothetical protein